MPINSRTPRSTGLPFSLKRNMRAVFQHLPNKNPESLKYGTPRLRCKLRLRTIKVLVEL